MKEITVVYDCMMDRRFLSEIDTGSPFIIRWIDATSKNGKKEAYKIKSHWGARKNPFVTVEEDNKIVKVFYSELTSAINQLINYLNNESTY